MKVLNIDGAVSTLSFDVVEWKKHTSISKVVQSVFFELLRDLS